MYIKRVIDANMGPLSKIDIKPSFDSEGNPKPLILVGENGSGKSTFISNIVDSFYELARSGFDDAVHQNSIGNGYAFYKIISGLQIKIGEKYLFSRIEFDNDVDYFFVSGECSTEKFKEESGYEGSEFKWNTNENKKHVRGISKNEIKKLFAEQVFCYFGPDRYEKPSWMGDSYYDDLGTHLCVEPHYSGQLQNPITAYNMGKENFRWLLDLIVDSRTDVESRGNVLQSVHVDIGNLMAMTVSRTNIERIMSDILGEEVYFGLNLRRDGGARFNIKRKSDNAIVAPTMDSLSTGQLALFNVFSTIVRYADKNDISKSIHMNQIKGIVVIDEIELHLHSVHQKEILPRLMKLFPGVQFIVTTHSPLFLLGMNDEYGEDEFDVYQMPDGICIGVERFCEFNRAYSYFAETDTHHAKLMEAINKNDTGKPIIITEGSTDWKHLIAAYNGLSVIPEYKELFENLSIDFFMYEPANSPKEAEYKVEMGNTALVSMCEAYAKMPQKRKMIFIADRDNHDTNKKMGKEGGSYKDWGNNVYSLILPIPDSRKETPDICIEHLYSDEEIKTEYIENNIPRRLFLGYEFNSKGVSKDLGKMCEKKKICGPGKIAIIEGSSGEKVYDLFADDDINYALSKMQFAECVLEKKEGFENFDFKNFIDVFKIISEIVSNDDDGI